MTDRAKTHLEQRLEALGALYDKYGRSGLENQPLADVNLLLASYMRTLVLLALSTLTAYGIFFSILGVPYAVLLAALAGMLEFIPMVGTLAASLTIVIVAAFEGAHVIAVLIFLLAYRLFQDYILSPQLMRQGVELFLAPQHVRYEARNLHKRANEFKFLRLG